MQFDLRDLRSAGAQLGSAVGLFECAKLEFYSPATPVNETGLLGGQFLVIENVGHQVGLTATIVKAEQAQHQRRLLLPHRRIGPAVDDVAPLTNHAQVFQQPNIAADADQEAMIMIEDRPPELIADKAGIGTKQRELREPLLTQQRLQVTTLPGIRLPHLPAPTQAQASAPTH